MTVLLVVASAASGCAMTLPLAGGPLRTGATTQITPALGGDIIRGLRERH